MFSPLPLPKKVFGWNGLVSVVPFFGDRRRRKYFRNVSCGSPALVRMILSFFSFLVLPCPKIKNVLDKGHDER